MGTLLKRSIPSINGLQEELDAKLVTEHIVDGLASTEAEHALSANQGRILEDKKLDKTDVVDGLISTSTIKALSANQGRILSELAGTKIDKTSIIDALNVTDTDVPLSANQGVVLLGLINGSASGLQYRGLWDAFTTTILPSATGAGDFYIILASGTIFGLEMAAGDMIISNGATDGLSSAGWDKIDNTESADILRTGDIETVVVADSTDIITGGAVVDYLNSVKADTLASQPRVIVDRIDITGNVATLSQEPIEGYILDDKVTIYNGDGTYDEWEGVTVTGSSMAIDDAGTTYDGKPCKVTYTYLSAV